MRSSASPTAFASLSPAFSPSLSLANLVCGLERREPPASAGEVLDWSAVPLSTQEVAVMGSGTAAEPVPAAADLLGAREGPGL